MNDGGACGHRPATQPHRHSCNEPRAYPLWSLVRRRRPGYMQRRVVVTGMGAVSPLGLDVPTLWQGICTAASGVGPVTLCETEGLELRIAGEVKGFEPQNYMDRKEIRRTTDLSISRSPRRPRRCARPSWRSHPKTPRKSARSSAAASAGSGRSPRATRPCATVVPVVSARFWCPR